MDKSSIARNTCGFSLLELMLVIGISAIISAFAIPAFVSWLPGYRLKSAAIDLYTHIQSVRMMAIKNNRPYGIVFNEAGNSYQLMDSNTGTFDDGDETPLPSPVNIILSTVYGSNVRFGHGDATEDAKGVNPPGESVTYANDRIAFDARGLTIGGEDYVHIEADGGHSYAVGTLRTGVVLLKRWNGTVYE